MKSILITTVLFILTHATGLSYAQEQSKPATAPSAATTVGGAKATSQSDQERRFTALLTDAFLSGRWVPLKDGELGEEKSGDKYHVISAVKGDSDHWTINAKLKYHDQEFVLPIPVQMKFAGDTAIMVVDKLSIPNGGTYSARLLFYERTYSGTWSGGRGGGMLYGVITNGAGKQEKAKESQ